MQHAVNIRRSLNSVCCFRLNTGPYQITQKDNHGSSRLVRSEELPQTLTVKKAAVTEGDVAHSMVRLCAGVVRLHLEEK